MAYQYIANLSDDSENMVIKVRVTRVWEGVNQKTGALIVLNLLLLDEQETCIHATIRTNFVPKFRPLIQEGQIYALKSFRLTRYKDTETHRPTSLPRKIIFQFTTLVTAHVEPELQIKTNKFDFADFETITQRQQHNQHLTDIQGQLATVGEVQEIIYLGNPRLRRDIHIMLPEGNKIRVSLWGDLISEIENHGINKTSGLVTVIVSLASVKNFRGEVYLSSTNATRLFINSEPGDLQEVSDVDIYASQTIEWVNKGHSSTDSVTFSIDFNRKTIEEIFSLLWESKMDENVFTCLAKIVGVDTYVDWYYMGCERCHRKIKADEEFWCKHCLINSKFPMPRYRIPLKVEDKTKAATFVLFDREGEQLLKKQAKQLINKALNEDTDLFQPAISKLSGKDLVFQLKLNDYNWKEGSHLFTVTKIYDPAAKTKLNTELDLLTEEAQNAIIAGPSTYAPDHIVKEIDEIDSQRRNYSKSIMQQSTATSQPTSNGKKKLVDFDVNPIYPRSNQQPTKKGRLSHNCILDDSD